MRTDRWRMALLGIALGLLVVTAGCSGGGDGAAAPATPQPTGEAMGASGGGGGDAGDDRVSNGETFQVRKRAIIRSGQATLEVEDFDDARRNLTRAVRRYGGFVSDSHVEVHTIDNATFETGTLVVRVPRENFSAMMARVRATGTVQSASTSANDVTDRLIDVNARLENLRAERERLRELYRNASDTEAILAIERRLSAVQGKIERLKAQRKELRRRVALSTIRVELREPEPEPEPDPSGQQWYDTPVVAAFLNSANGVVVTLRALVVAGAYALPYVLAFGLPIGGVAYAARRWRGGDAVAADTADAPDRGDRTGTDRDDDETANGSRDE